MFASVAEKIDMIDVVLAIIQVKITEKIQRQLSTSSLLANVMHVKENENEHMLLQYGLQ